MTNLSNRNLKCLLAEWIVARMSKWVLLLVLMATNTIVAQKSAMENVGQKTKTIISSVLIDGAL